MKIFVLSHVLLSWFLLFEAANASSIQIIGVVQQGDRPIPWDDQYTNTQSEQYKKLEEDLCTTLHKSLKSLQNIWDQCKIDKVFKDPRNTSLVYSVTNVSLLGDNNPDLNAIRDELVSVFSPSSFPNVLAGEINVHIPYIRIAGVVQKGPYPLSWNDSFADGNSPEFKSIEKSLCQSIEDALTILSGSWNGCKLVVLQKATEDATQVYAFTDIALTGNKSIDLELVRDQLEKKFSESMNAISLGSVTVFGPYFVTTSAVQLGGIVQQGTKQIEWSDNYLPIGSYLYNVVQQSICSSMYMVFNRMKITPNDCTMYQIKKYPNDLSLTYAAINVTFDGEQTIDLNRVLSEMQSMKVEFPDKTILGGNIDITIGDGESITGTTAAVPTVTQTSTPDAKTTVDPIMPTVGAITTSAIEVAGIAVQGNVPVSWTDQFSSINSIQFKMLQQALCASTRVVLDEANIQPKECRVMELKKPSVDVSQVYARLYVGLDGERTINVEQLKARLEALAATDTERTVIGRDIEITAAGGITTSSIHISGIALQGNIPVPWTEQYSNTNSIQFLMFQQALCSSTNIALDKLGLHWSKCSIAGLKRPSPTVSEVYVLLNVGFDGERTINVEQLRLNLEALAVSDPERTVIGRDIGITSAGGISASSISISGIALQGTVPVPWTDQYLNTDSIPYRMLQQALCASTNIVLGKAELQWSKCSITGLKRPSPTVSEVYVLLNVGFDGERTINVEQLRLNLEALAVSDPERTVIGRDIEITSNVSNI